jgi:hypothetical protein
MSARNAAVALRKATVEHRDSRRHLEPSDTVAFVGECGMAGCFDVVWLDYDSQRGDPQRAVLACGDSPATVRKAA